MTGGAGFIGSHLVDALVSVGARVRVLDDLSTGRLENLVSVRDRIDFRQGDIRDFETCRAAADGVQIVFHQAARGSVPRSMEDPATTFWVNSQGTVNVFAASRDSGVHRVVYASSSSVYGDSQTLPKLEGQEGRPLSPYALSKRMNEEAAEVFRRCFGMELIGLRYFNVYGPRQDPSGPYAAVIPRFFAACVAGQAPVIFGDGSQSRDFTCVEDAVRANLLAASAPPGASGGSYNVASGRAVTVLRAARAVQEIARGGLEPRFEPPRPGDIAHSLASLDRSRRLLGYEPDVDFDEGLRRAAPWYMSRGIPATWR